MNHNTIFCLNYKQNYEQLLWTIFYCYGHLKDIKNLMEEFIDDTDVFFILSLQEAHYDHDLDGQLRRPRRTLTSQGRRPSFTALTTLLSTSRPLLTQYAPSTAHQSLYCVPSDPDMEGRGTPEQQRALLTRSNEV